MARRRTATAAQPPRAVQPVKVDPQFVQRMANFLEGGAGIRGIWPQFQDYIIHEGWPPAEIDAQLDAIYRAVEMER